MYISYTIAVLHSPISNRDACMHFPHVFMFIVAHVSCEALCVLDRIQMESTYELVNISSSLYAGTPRSSRWEKTPVSRPVLLECRTSWLVITHMRDVFILLCLQSTTVFVFFVFLFFNLSICLSVFVSNYYLSRFPK
jgi:hypothetical protein